MNIEEIEKLIIWSPEFQPINQDVKVRICHIPYEALIPYIPILPQWLKENPIPARWVNLADDDEPPQWYFEGPSEPTAIAGSIVMSNTNTADSNLYKKILKDKLSNALLSLKLFIEQIENYKGKSGEQLKAEEEAVKALYEAGPPEELK